MTKPRALDLRGDPRCFVERPARGNLRIPLTRPPLAILWKPGLILPVRPPAFRERAPVTSFNLKRGHRATQLHHALDSSSGLRSHHALSDSARVSIAGRERPRRERFAT